MGVDFFLTCGDCCEFIDLHKWWVIEEAGKFLVDAHYEPGQYPDQLRPQDSPFPFVDFNAVFKRLIITAEQIEAALSFYVPVWPYIAELTPIVRMFASQHRGHLLFLACDMGDDEPCLPDQRGFEVWLEVPGPFRFHQYLPRNLVEVAEFQNWSDVLEAMSLEWPFQYADYYASEIEAIRTAFERLRAERRV